MAGIMASLSHLCRGWRNKSFGIVMVCKMPAVRPNVGNNNLLKENLQPVVARHPATSHQ